jgi:hypothetical protein
VPATAHPALFEDKGVRGVLAREMKANKWGTKMKDKCASPRLPITTTSQPLAEAEGWESGSYESIPVAEQVIVDLKAAELARENEGKVARVVVLSTGGVGE